MSAQRIKPSWRSTPPTKGRQEDGEPLRIHRAGVRIGDERAMRRADRCCQNTRVNEIADNIGLATSIVALAAATFAGWRFVAKLYRETLGSRRELQEKIWRLGPGVTVRHVEALLGPPTYLRSLTQRDVPGSLATSLASVYFTRHASIQVLHTEPGIVIGIAITTVDRKFHPSIRQLPRVVREGHPVLLGRTRFSEIPNEDADSAWLLRGAQLSKYSELMYFGRPGGYLTFDLSFNPVGAGEFDLTHCEQGFAPGDLQDGMRDDWRAFREGTTINTVAVYASGVSGDELRNSSLRCGIDHDVTPSMLTRPIDRASRRIALGQVWRLLRKRH
jgi:hypothetical protein